MNTFMRCMLFSLVVVCASALDTLRGCRGGRKSGKETVI